VAQFIALDIFYRSQAPNSGKMQKNQIGGTFGVRESG
jgi:hypothetical protein